MLLFVSLCKKKLVGKIKASRNLRETFLEYKVSHRPVGSLVERLWKKIVLGRGEESEGGGDRSQQVHRISMVRRRAGEPERRLHLYRRAHDILSVCWTVIIGVSVYAKVEYPFRKRSMRFSPPFVFSWKTGREESDVTYSASVVATLAISAGRKLLCWLGGWWWWWWWWWSWCCCCCCCGWCCCWWGWCWKAVWGEGELPAGIKLYGW